MKRDGTNAVLVRSKELDIELWIDVDVVDGEIRSDWNQYVFHLDNPRDVRVRDIQNCADNFMAFTEVAEEYLIDCGVLVQDENDNWKMI